MHAKMQTHREDGALVRFHGDIDDGRRGFGGRIRNEVRAQARRRSSGSSSGSNIVGGCW